MASKRTTHEAVPDGSTGRQFQLDEPASSHSHFTFFRAALDAHHERRERVIKASRDITAHSKKIIFALQRCKAQPSKIPPSIAKDVDGKLDTIRGLLKSLHVDLSGVDAWRYQRQISGGLQELIEALTFKEWLENGRLLTNEEIGRWVRGEDEGEGVTVTGDDYVLGIFDLTGEMMKWCITNMSTLDFQAPEGPLHDLRTLRSGLEALSAGSGGTLGKELGKKMQVMQNSVEKVEFAAYGIIVRGREKPKGWTPDLSSGSRGGEIEVDG